MCVCNCVSMLRDGIYLYMNVKLSVCLQQQSGNVNSCTCHLLKSETVRKRGVKYEYEFDVGRVSVVISVMQIAVVFFTSRLTADKSEIPASLSMTLFIIPSITQDTNTAGGKP